MSGRLAKKSRNETARTEHPDLSLAFELELSRSVFRPLSGELEPSELGAGAAAQPAAQSSMHLAARRQRQQSARLPL